MPEQPPVEPVANNPSPKTVQTTSDGDQDAGRLDQRAGVDRVDQQAIGWRELVRDFVKPGRAQVIFAAILLVLGLGVAMQVRTQAAETDYSTLRRADLVQLLDDLNAESRRLETEIAQLEETKRQLQTGADSERVAREEAQRRLDVLSILGGTAPAQGPGIRITILDPSRKVTPELLLNTVQELRDAGAEVIAINHTVRVVASTWFGSNSSGIIVDDQLVTVPITIDVIGEPHALTESTRFSGGLVSEVQGARVGGTVSVVSDELVTITAVIVPSPNRFAKPA
ncbi:MAG: DUF881 domain-containing protein [Micropruina sp.]|nr:DUF881 domain-containing protein [Micropruina sp.]